MKKALIALVAILLLSLSANACQASAISWSDMTDQQLQQAYQEIRAEASHRGLLLVESMSLSEGLYIVGQDIKEGEYVITCVSTDADNVSRSFDSLGSALDGLGVSNNGTSYSDLYSSLGSAFSALDDGVKIEIVGDYGSVLRTIQLKKGQSASLKLEGKVALRISDGECKLEMK